MIRALGLLLVSISSAAAQFEVASIKPSPPNSASGSSGMYTGKGRIDANGLTLKYYIMRAYAVGKNEVIGGPDWLEADRYDIMARAAAPENSQAALLVCCKPCSPSDSN